MKSFKTENVIIRRFEMRDAKQAYHSLSIYEDEGKMCNGNEPVNETFEQTKVIIKSAINEYYTDEPIWAVEDKETKRLVGFIRITNYSPRNKICKITWSMLYTQKYENFVKDALVQVLKFIFTKKDVELVECSYYEANDENVQNSENQNILNGIGMIKEAVLRNRRFNEKTNKKENFVIYSMDKNEFFEKNNIQNVGNLKKSTNKFANKISYKVCNH